MSTVCYPLKRIMFLDMKEFFGMGPNDKIDLDKKNMWIERTKQGWEIYKLFKNGSKEVYLILLAEDF